MARYIDADALIERLKFKRDETDKVKKKYSGLECAISQVQKQPTADVVEVKRGKWKKHFSYGLLHYDCPFCDDGFAVKEDFIVDQLPNYCSNCGAKMDGERKCDNDGEV